MLHQYHVTILVVPKELPIPEVSRSNGGADIDVTWNSIAPNRDEGEGYVFRYDIRYFQYAAVTNGIVVKGGNVTSFKIEGVDEDADYSVQVRVVVINSTEPMLTFEYGGWSGKLIQKPIGESTVGIYLLNP